MHHGWPDPYSANWESADKMLSAVSYKSKYKADRTIHEVRVVVVHYCLKIIIV